ncbi:MAG: hypothetical protein H7301_13840 [Cryobacterium sp.]|nr:hypothetical protein [Oligoflexia bacterium]
MTSPLTQLLQDEEIRQNRVENVRTILVVLSGRSVVYDDASLRQKIQMTYPEAKIYFVTTDAKPFGEKMSASAKIDLLIDFTGVGHGHKWFFARRMRSRARVCVGRNAGFFRAHIYDRVIADEHYVEVGQDVISRERIIQREVLAEAGVPLSHQGDLGRDLGKTIANSARR